MSEQINNKINIKNKNRTLQFYKFLFYSLKVELKVHEFINIVRFSNFFELLLWLISLIFYFTTKHFPAYDKNGEERDYSYNIVWLQIIHVLRAAIGLYIYYTFPKSYVPIEKIKSIDDNKLETIFFNDLVRETVDETIVKPIQSKKLSFLFYIGFTIFNVIIDLISFIELISNLHNSNASFKVILLTYVYINVVYLIIDFRYFLWFNTIKYVFPPKYTKPIKEMFQGAANRLLIAFKLKKEKTNINNEMMQVRDIIVADNNNNFNNKFNNNEGSYKNNNINPDSNLDDIKIDI